MEKQVEKAIDRIKKLLALATSSNPNEAATAAAQAASLMTQYELEEADLRLESGAANSDPIDNTFWEGLEGSRIAEWKSTLIIGLVKAFDCYCWWSPEVVGRSDIDLRRKTVQRVRVIGRRSNVQTANYLFLYLTNELEKMANVAWNHFCTTLESLSFHGKHWKNSFLTGAASIIRNRLYEQIKQNHAVQETSKAMVLVMKDREEVEKYYNVAKPAGLHSVSASSVRINKNAYEQGKEAGRTISLGGDRQGIGAAPKQLKSC